MVTVNAREYAWGDIVLWILGQPVYGARGIEYKKTKEKTHLHAAGRDPKSIQHGKRVCEGSVTLTQSEVAALNRSAQAKGYRDFLDVDIDIIVSYGSDNLVMTVDKVVCASFSEIPKNMKEGDNFMDITMPFLCLDIKEGI